MIVLKSKEKVYFTVSQDNDVKVSSNVPESGLTFEMETLSNIEYLKLVMLSKKFKDDEEGFIAIIEEAQKRIIKIHNSKAKPENFTFDLYVLLISKLIESSTLSESETLSFV